MALQPIAKPSSLPDQIGGRYAVTGLLGRGGTALVYSVTDLASGRACALKQLPAGHGGEHSKDTAALFEREFHTLAQLSHPRIIEVYDYGLDPGGPYYTMELLDQGDLRELSPLPWRDACALLYDVCSSLALIHSRRLVHRDVSPRNVRRARDGRGKLIDFGGLSPMGHSPLVVGTPPFVAPEVVHRSSLDARTDLFSLGATLYYALTGRAAYPAREFSQLFEVWRHKPAPPSALAPDVPPALDALVLALISIDAAVRPRTASEVMSKLAAIAGLEREEQASVSQAYLATPSMVGRQRALAIVERHMRRALAGRGGSLVIDGAPGLGCSRMLDASVLVAKTLGATVLRAGANAVKSRDFGLMQALSQQLIEALPEAALESAAAAGVAAALFEPEPPQPQPGEGRSGIAPRRLPRLRLFARAAEGELPLETAISRFWLALSETHPLAIAVDDLQHVDESSAVVLATLASQRRSHHLALTTTLESGTEAPEGSPLASLRGHSQFLTLTPLSREQCEQLLASVFGDVPNLGAVSDAIHNVALGVPRACIDLAQHLCDRGTVRYEGGSWTLPSTLGASDLPQDAGEALRERVALLSPLARALLEAHALGTNGVFSRDDYARLCPDDEAAALERAISELISQQLLTGDGRAYALVHRGWTDALVAHLAPDERRARHRALAGLYGDDPVSVHHLLEGGEEARALDQLVPVLRAFGDGLDFLHKSGVNAATMALLFERTLDAAERLKRPVREQNDIRRWLATVGVISDERFYYRAAPAWLAQLKQDSGYARFLELGSEGEPGERIGKALGEAFERYNATPEAERCYRPDEAIQRLVHYVVLSIAVGTRSLDTALIASLPELLGPFTGLSKVVAAIYENAYATYESRCLGQPERARARWLGVYDTLSAITGSELQYVSLIRPAVAMGIATVETYMGKPSADEWAGQLEKDPLQAVNALYLRKCVRLQQGDYEGAEALRRKAELEALSAHARGMFASAVSIELVAHGLAGDLTGVKQVLDRLRPLAARFRGWTPACLLGEAYFHRLCGDHAQALSRLEAGLELCAPGASDPIGGISQWPGLMGLYLETLVVLDRAAEARPIGLRALATCDELAIDFGKIEIARALALAEAKLSDYESATARLEQVIESQLQLGITGLHLGASYEARARVAIWMGDAEAVEQYARLVAREYRYGRGSALGARYERLVEEALARLAGALPGLSEFVTTSMETSTVETRDATSSLITEAFGGAREPADRAARALGLICDDRGAHAGHLYLFTEAGLTHMASLGRPAPNGELSAIVRAHVARELEECDRETAIATATAVQTPSSVRSALSDTDGTAYQSVLLTCNSAGKSNCAGIALLALESLRERPLRGRAMESALASYLLDEGDACGVTLVR